MPGSASSANAETSTALSTDSLRELRASLSGNKRKLPFDRSVEPNLAPARRRPRSVSPSTVETQLESVTSTVSPPEVLEAPPSPPSRLTRNCMLAVMRKTPVVVPLGADSSDDAMALRRALGPWKMVLVVRTDLGMGKGKIGAQCSHAALAAYKASMCESNRQRGLVERWEDAGQAKVVLKVANEGELQAIHAAAREAGLVSTLISDAGHTQVEAGSVTVCAIGPDVESAVDRVTGHLKLL